MSPIVILAMMTATAAVSAVALLPIEGPQKSGDFTLYLFGWMDSIRQHGLASVSGEFSQYTPPYIYLLNLAALIEPWVGTVTAIKLINLPFVVLCAWGIGALVREVGGDRDRGTLAAAVAIVCPSLLINAFAHGQCDSIFTSFLIWFIYFAVRQRAAVACVMFGLALSFKLQAVFVSPLLLALVQWRRIKLWHLLVIPATYIVLMVPAAIAGRPWTQLLTIYVRQRDVMHDLSLNAPNPWWLLRDMVDYRVGLIVGLAAGIAAIGMLAWRSLRVERNAVTILLIATASAALLPWLLPKMTARYFIVADLLTIALAFVRPRLWPAAVLIQLGSLLAIVAYFTPWNTAAAAFWPTTMGVGILVYELFGWEGRRANAAV